jgi:cytochrome c-type biogenesis protein CcmE
LIAATIAILISALKGASTYDTVETAIEKKGKFVHLMARLDKTVPIDYDAVKNPNYLSFVAVDTTGKKVKVIYRKGKPDNLEISERLVLKGKYLDNYFECQDIQTKCPSKYKDEMKPSKEMQTTPTTSTTTGKDQPQAEPEPKN